MEQILNKLSEIEATANAIMQDAARQKQALSEEAEKQTKEFDASLEKETSDEIRNRSGYRKIPYRKDPGNQGSERASGIRDRRSEEYRKSPSFQTASYTQCEKGISTGSLSAEGGCDRAGLQRTGVF